MDKKCRIILHYVKGTNQLSVHIVFKKVDTQYAID